MEKKSLIFLLIVVLSGVLYYHLVSEPNHTKIEITRVIDGDTVVLENARVRLLGINTPEKNMPGYLEAKEFLKQEITGKQIYLETTGTDRYGRFLGYLFTKDENINQKILENGYAHLFYYDIDNYYPDMRNSEASAREKGLGIWERSNYSVCLKLVSLKYYDPGDENETLILKNDCKKEIKVIIKDDATHIYKENIPSGLYTKTLHNIFNDDKDSLYVWDEEGKLIIFYRYS